MLNNLRLPLVLAALAAAVASQALTLNYSGNGSATAVNGTFTTTSTGAQVGDQFGFVRSVTTGAMSQVQLFDASGNNGLTLVYANPIVVNYPDGTGSLFQSFATATGFGNLSGYVGTGIGITRNLRDSYAISIQGSNVTPQAVPEPAALAAVGLGALGLLRRRARKA